jgi:hypothetical protein
MSCDLTGLWTRDDGGFYYELGERRQALGGAGLRSHWSKPVGSHDWRLLAIVKVLWADATPPTYSPAER